MSTIERKVRIAQRRLWLNRWLTQWGWSLTGAFALWLIGWVVNRLFGFYPFPAGWTLIGAAAASLVGATVWLYFTRDAQLSAATALDKAAGLRERVSTGLLLKASSDDPFETAVIQDATARVNDLTPRKFLPIRWPGSLSWSGVLVLVALLSLLLPEFDLLNRKQGNSAAQAGQNSRTQAVLSKANDTIEKIAEKNDIDLNAAQKKPKGRVQMPKNNDPDLKRRETLKKLDRLQDSLKKKIGDEKFEALKETKKRLKQLGEQTQANSELGELMSAMANNNFDEAEKAVKKLQEKLAKRQAEGDAKPEETQKIQEQLKEMAKKLKEASKKSEEKQKEQQIQDLKNAGMTQEQAQRALEELSKKDPEQLKKMAQELAERMKENGVTKEQMQEMLEKMQEQQKACEKSGGQCNKMGEKMNQAAQKMQQGDTQGAMQELGEAGEQLSEMEQMEQTLNDLESQMSELDQTQQQMENEADSEKDGEKKSDKQKDSESCKQCEGTGFRKDGSPCPDCKGTGQCKGGQGRQGKDGKGGGKGGTGGSKAGTGAGGNRMDGDDDFDNQQTENKKAKTKIGQGGRVTGQQLVKDKQMGGESTATMSDAGAAEEIDDTDAVERERIPRMYRKGVKRFFDRLDEEEAEADGDAKSKSDAKPVTGEKAKEALGAKSDADGKDDSKQAGDSKPETAPKK